MGEDTTFADRARGLLERLDGPVRWSCRERLETAADFNVFEAAGIERRELSHSAFVAGLLNPRGSHGQGILFLSPFLRDLVGLDVDDAALAATHVATEYSIGDRGRLDILLRCGSKFVVAIENKVGAGERDDQIADYQDWLFENRTAGPSRLVFLTPDGRKPATGNTTGVLRLSYGDLAQWLDTATREVPKRAAGLGEAVRQYAALCWRLGGDMTRQNATSKEIAEILSDPANLETAMEFAPHVRIAKGKEAREFWENVETNLRDRLEKGRWGDSWTILRDTEILNPNKGLHFVPKGMPDWHYFSMAVYSVALDAPHSCYLGVERPYIDGRNKPQNVSDPTEGSLLEKLRTKGIDRTSEDWSVAWAYADKVGFDDFNLSSPSLVRALAADNQSEGKPKAAEVADRLYELFADCAMELSALNRMSV